MSQQLFSKITAVLFCLVLAACGGGGGEESNGNTLSQTGDANNTGTNTNTGGTGAGGSTTNPDGGASGPTTGSDGGTPPTPGAGGTPSTGGSGGDTTSPPASAFSAQLISAPSTADWLGSNPDGGPFYDTVRFEVSGTGLGNVELVSANDPSIKYGTFTISADGTRATLDWDYDVRDSNNRIYSAFDLRVLAWDVPAGESGSSIEVMEPRRYYRKISPGCGPSCVGAAP
jgi:hypothetical protein